MLMYTNKPLDGAVCIETCIPSEGGVIYLIQSMPVMTVNGFIFFFHFNI